MFYTAVFCTAPCYLWFIFILWFSALFWHLHCLLQKQFQLCNCYRSCLWYNYFLSDNSHSTSPITKLFKVAENLGDSAKQFLCCEIWLDKYTVSLDCLTFHLYCLSHTKVSYPSGVASTWAYSWIQHDFPASFQIHYVSGWWYGM